MDDEDFCYFVYYLNNIFLFFIYCFNIFIFINRHINHSPNLNLRNNMDILRTPYNLNNRAVRRYRHYDNTRNILHPLLHHLYLFSAVRANDVLIVFKIPITIHVLKNLILSNRKQHYGYPCHCRNAN